MQQLHSTTWVRAILCAGLLAAAAMQPARADSTTITVNSSADTVANDGQCTLREAITSANTDTASGAAAGECAAGVPGSDMISFAANYTITTGSPLPDITTPIALNGKGAANTIIQANALPGTAGYRLLYVALPGELVLAGLTVRNSGCNGACPPDFYGGAILNTSTLTLSNSRLTGNTGYFGGAIYNTSVVTVLNSTIDGNSATSYGGAIYHNGGAVSISGSTISGNHAGASGGAISNMLPVTVTDSTFESNTATEKGGAIYSSDNLSISGSSFLSNSAGMDGGAIDVFSATATVTTSTFYGNSTTAGSGGAIFNSAYGTLSVTASTLSTNSASLYGGDLSSAGSLSMTNDILAAGGLTGDCFTSGTFAVNDHNLVQDGSCNPALSGDPQLAAPAINFGYGTTKTMALLLGSPAIDAGSDAACLTYDQRSLPRPQGLHCDIGAYEFPLRAIFQSAGAQDGWVLESTETSSIGGSKNATGGTFRLGDDALDRQFRAILSFDTSGLPDNILVSQGMLGIMKQGVGGTNPFKTHGALLIDVRAGSFANNPALQLADFRAVGNLQPAGSVSKVPSAGWYTGTLSANALLYVNPTGLTQLRLRFQKGDNDDMSADYIKFYSGDYSVTGSRPVLVVEYYVIP